MHNIFSLPASNLHFFRLQTSSLFWLVQEVEGDSVEVEADLEEAEVQEDVVLVEVPIITMKLPVLVMSLVQKTIVTK
jgi:hypothetical protein